MSSRSRRCRNPRRHRGNAIVSLAVLLLLIPLLTAALVKSHSHRLYGGYVRHADASIFEKERSPVAIVGVSVLSPEGDRMLPAHTVVADEGRIVAIAPDAVVPGGADVVDGRGRYLIPGLVDAHVHLRKQPNDLLLYIANGVTTVRDLAGSKADLALRDEIAAGRIGPRLVVASPMLFTAGPMKGAFDAFVSPRKNAGNARLAGNVVDSLVAQGYDAIKTYADLDLGAYRAINRRAAELGIHTVGHLPDGFDLAELAFTQQREIAHIEEIVKALQREFRALAREDYAAAFPDFVAERADRIIGALLENDITVNSTLWLAEVVGRQAFGLEEALRSLPLEYANPAMVEGSPYVAAMGWLPGRNQFEVTREVNAYERKRTEATWAARAEAHRVLCRRMAERGVRITAGTDATSHLTIAGFSMHDELESLAGCGMSPAGVLQAATVVPAALMNSDTGVIDVGRPADLVLLSADPLEDIANTRRIEAVFLDGRHFNHRELDAMLGAVREAHAASRKFDLSAYK